MNVQTAPKLCNHFVHSQSMMVVVLEKQGKEVSQKSCSPAHFTSLKILPLGAWWSTAVYGKTYLALLELFLICDQLHTQDRRRHSIPYINWILKKEKNSQNTEFFYFICIASWLLFPLSSTQRRHAINLHLFSEYRSEPSAEFVAIFAQVSLEDR